MMLVSSTKVSLLFIPCVLYFQISDSFPINRKTRATAFLKAFGYLKKEIADNDTEKWNEAILKAQKFGHLKLTGVLDKETEDLMEVPRCQHVDVEGENDFIGLEKFKEFQEIFKQRRKNKGRREGRGRIRTKRYYVVGMFQQSALTYSVLNYPSSKINLTDSQVEDIVKWAFEAWLEHARDLEITKATEGEDSDFRVSFVAGDHNDTFPFDGPGRVIGHAFYPTKGDIHLDDDESWSRGTKEGINFQWVVLHEIGHALGLGHSSDLNAVMDPYYFGYSENVTLGTDDIAGIFEIY